MRTGTGEGGAAELSYGRQRLCLVQAVAQAVAQAAARVTQEKTGEGRRWCDQKANPSPLFISLTRQPKSHFPLNFAVIANLAKPASPPALQNF